MRRLLPLLLVLGTCAPAFASQISRPSNRLGGALTFTGATGVNQILFPDNLSDGLIFAEGANAFLTLRSTNAGERIFLQKPVTFTSAATITTGTASVTFGDDITFSANTRRLIFPDNTTWSITESSNVYIQTVSLNGAERVAFGKPQAIDLATSLAGTGTVQSGATALTHHYNVCTTATTGSADAFVLPTAVAGLSIALKNNSAAATIDLFPATGAQICMSGSACIAVDTEKTIATDVEVSCVAESATKWNCR